MDQQRFFLLLFIRFIFTPILTFFVVLIIILVDMHSFGLHSHPTPSPGGILYSLYINYT